MDSRIYFHQNRRPRYNNPTYLSNNVNGSLTFFNGNQGNNYNMGSNSPIKSINNHYDQYLNQSMAVGGNDHVNRQYNNNNYNSNNSMPLNRPNLNHSSYQDYNTISKEEKEYNPQQYNNPNMNKA